MMDKFNGLLSKISKQYHILQGNTEPELKWKARLVYSICGMMAYASLWDDTDESVSLVHLRKRIRSILHSYKSLYSELSGTFPSDSESLENEIIHQFLCTGVVYHSPRRIVASRKHEEHFGEILFQRGIALDAIHCVSGIGFYTKKDGGLDINRIKAMFGLEREHLQTVWQNTISSTSWKSNSLFDLRVEYLRIKPPFNQGYWEASPNKTGAISILRAGMEGTELYYLYRYVKGVLEISPLPQWQVEHHNYRALACALLSNHKTLPPIEYIEDGSLVHIRMKYLLPPRELVFLKLYSWPESYAKLPCNFKRILSTEVFISIKKILSDAGYEFKEGKPDAQWSKLCP